MQDKPITNEQIEDAVREAAKNQNADGLLFKMVAHVDELRANGRNVEFRLDAKNQRVTVVEIEQVTVDLVGLADENGEMPVGEDGKPLIDFAWADEPEDQAAV